MINNRIYTENYFPNMTELEDTKNRNDLFVEYFIEERKEFVRKYVKEKDYWCAAEGRALRERFLNGENVYNELNNLYYKLGEPRIKDLEERLYEKMEELGIKPNKVLNATKKQLEKNLEEQREA